MNYILTKTPYQKINKMGISSQWEGTHIRFIHNDKLSPSESKTKRINRMFIISIIQLLMIILLIYIIS